jgi:prenyltransferase beta subunit
MQIRKKIIIIGIIFLSFGVLTNTIIPRNTLATSHNQAPLSSSEQYEKDLDSVITKKLGDYDTLTYFPQIYEPSLQAIYYALFIYHALDQLDQIDQNELFNDTMGYYDSSSGLFYDVYAYRYLDLDPSQGYYPYSSLLQVNCYAVQSLALLDRLGSIDTQYFIDFIWSCYNPISDGFIGQPYDPSLEPMYRISTMDNTYYAVITLNLLLETWDDYSAEKNRIIQFVNSLQISLNVDWKYGGFYNDEDVSFDSITPTMEPSLISSYYCIKTLEVFEMEETIHLDGFHQFLTAHYKDDTYFEISTPEHYKTNLVATALGLELSQITAFLEINETNLITFIISNRNSQGTWDSSTNVHMHELMDTFQIIRSLKNTGAISNLSSLDKMEIAGALNNYKQYTGFSLISKEYTTLQLLNTLISSLELFDQISDLELQSVYNDIEECFRYLDYPEDWYAFLPYICADPYSPEFRSFPIEFYTRGYHTYLDRIDYLATYKSMFFALNSMEKMYKLDDFGTMINFTYLINDIIQSQFLVEAFPEAYGAFVPSRRYTFFSNESQAQKIFFEYSFYAIKCLELLASNLAVGNLTAIPFDQDALYSYIDNNIVETSSHLYFDPRYTDDVSIRFQNTYYMVYVLNALDRYALDSQKIRTYIINNLDYNNIKNIYFAFKISHLLNLSIPFNLFSAVDLVEEIFSEEYKEYYRTTERISIDHEVIVWIAEMIKYNFFEYQGTVDPPPGDDQKTNLEPAIPLALVFIIVPGSVFMISNKQLNSKKRKLANNTDKKSRF